MKRAFETWKWSLGVVAHSPVPLLGLAVLSAFWGLAAYQWLWLPESSLFILLVSLIWALALVLLAVAVLSGTVAGASEAAAVASRRLRLRTFWGFNRTQGGRCALMVLGSGLLVLAVTKVFGWHDDYSLAAASFLTFHSNTAISPVDVGKVFWVIEALLWTVIWGFLLSFLILLLRSGWREAWRRGARTLANCCFRASFWTSLLSMLVFGGLSYLLASWHPRVAPGFWDYAQMILRLGGALLLIVAGWLFWTLSLARLSSPLAERSPS